MVPPGWQGRAFRLTNAEIGAMGLLANGGILVVTAIVTGVLMAKHEARFVPLESRLGDLEHRLGQEWVGTPPPPTGLR